MGRHGAVALSGNARDGGVYRLMSHGHMMGVGVHQSAGIADHRNMAFPEQQITTLTRAGGLRKMRFLKVAVTRAENAAGQQSHLHKA